jgi:hypothetical protein
MSVVLKWFREQPVTTSKFLLQRRIMDPDRRDRIGAAVARGLPRPARLETDLSEAPLLLSGYQPLEVVGPEKAASMRAWFEQHPVHDHYGGTAGDFLPHEASERTHVGTFRDLVTLQAPHALAIANDPRVLDLVGTALGAKPIISLMSAWWSIPHPGEAREAELFHRDVDDWRFVKLFVYLTDVDEESGPHAYVPGSHRSSKLREIRRYTDSEVEAAYPGGVMTITGRAGDAFLENTQGLHRGVPPKSRLRLLFQVIYSLSKSPYGPARPIASRADFPDLELDPYINQAYLR